MKRYIKAATEYTDYTTISQGPQRFSVHYTPDEDTGMLRAQISEIHPYDDAEYAWAKIIGPQAIFYQNGKVVDKMSIAPYDFDEDETYESYTEYVDDIVDTVAAALKDINLDVKPVMVHN